MYVKRRYFNNEKEYMYFIYENESSTERIDEYFGKYTDAFIYALNKYDKFDIREIINYELQDKGGTF